MVAVIHQPRTSVFELFDDLIYSAAPRLSLGAHCLLGVANGLKYLVRGFIFHRKKTPRSIDIVSGSYVFNERVQLHSPQGVGNLLL